MIRAGSLRHKISIQKNTPTTNEFGERVSSFTEVVSTRALISPFTGNESFAKNVKNTVSHKIVVRGQIEVSPENQIVYNNRIFEIQYVLNWNEGSREKMILAIEKFE